MKPIPTTPGAMLRRLMGLALVAAVAGSGTASSADESAAAKADKPSSPLTLVAVDIQPEDPSAETLCRLGVELTNQGEQPISGLRFAVSVNGHSLPVYEKHVFLDVVPPGGKVNVPLYNFWVTETGRPLPEKGPLTVEVRVVDARWTRVELEPMDPEKATRTDSEGNEATAQEMVETWTLLDSLEVLPEAVTATRALRRP
ncbi:MAG: hypothetical protein MPN21_18905 [Thermoanaerobaculia bacterium]|nr:hypothetical protein [Thermoanaerobaculia bacterium]